MAKMADDALDSTDNGPLWRVLLYRVLGRSTATIPDGGKPEPRPVRFGFRPNVVQVLLLVLSMICMGSLIGIERSLLPLIAKDEFNVESNMGALSFIITFGLAKGVFNLCAGSLVDRFGRTVLVLSAWIVGVPIPFLLIFASHWGYVLFANVLLGINQAFLGTALIIMMIDTFGSKQRGLAVGICESTIYVFLSIMSVVATMVASWTNPRPEPFYIGIVVSIGGLVTSLFMKDTMRFVVAEREYAEMEEAGESGVPMKTIKAVPLPRVPGKIPLMLPDSTANATFDPDGGKTVVGAYDDSGSDDDVYDDVVLHPSPPPSPTESTDSESTEVDIDLSPDVLPLHDDNDDPSLDVASMPLYAVVLSCFTDPRMLALLQAGMCNNLRDGLCWGLLPIFFKEEMDLDPKLVSILCMLYPVIWGISQPFVGHISDSSGRELMLTGGFFFQGAALVLTVVFAFVLDGVVQFIAWLFAMVLLGLGTGMVYPLLQAQVSVEAEPEWRGTKIGVYRTLRDFGYAAGALMGGLLADIFSVTASLGVAAVLCFVTASWLWIVFPPPACACSSRREVTLEDDNSTDNEGYMVHLTGGQVKSSGHVELEEE